MPGWHETTRQLQREGKIQMLGIIEEQHPERTRLFMQWKQMDWPILVDSLNLLGVSAVPITLLIDEHGIIRKVNPKPPDFQEFLETSYTAEAGQAAKVALSRADQLFLEGEERRVGEVIQAYRQSLSQHPQEGALHFRLGVAHRKRYDSPSRLPDDFKQAVAHWSRALEIDPNQYIWRRRIQQYGPRLDKPYPFYDWIHEARQEIRSRGESPAELAVEPGGAEFAHPSKQFDTSSKTLDNPDPKGKIFRDREGLIQVETTVVPNTSAQAASARVHLVFRPNLKKKAHWNNEVDDLVVWVDPPAGWQVDSQLLSVANPPQAVSQEERRVEFELRGEGPVLEIPAYALYYVCEDVDGTCLFRRQDVRILMTPEGSEND